MGASFCVVKPGNTHLRSSKNQVQAKSEIYQKCLQGPNEEFQGVVQDLHGTQQDILDRDHVRFHPVVDVDHLGAVVAEEVVMVEVETEVLVHLVEAEGVAVDPQ